jgi:hypothetical protein
LERRIGRRIGRFGLVLLVFTDGSRRGGGGVERAVHVAVRAEAAVGVAAGVDFGERGDVDVGVNLGGFKLFVAQHFLDIPDVGPAAVHVGGAGVPPEMTGAGFVDVLNPKLTSFVITKF